MLRRSATAVSTGRVRAASFRDWRRFARQRGLHGPRLDGPQETRVSRDRLAGFENDHIPLHEVPGFDLLRPPIAQHGGVGNFERQQGMHGTPRRQLRDEPQRHIDHQDGDDRRGVEPVTRDERHGCRGEQQ
jgi:hypothetical protein